MRGWAIVVPTPQDGESVVKKVQNVILNTFLSKIVGLHTAVAQLSTAVQVLKLELPLPW